MDENKEVNDGHFSAETGENNEEAAGDEEGHPAQLGTLKSKACNYCEEEDTPGTPFTSNLDSHDHQLYFCPFCQHTSTRRKEHPESEESQKAKYSCPECQMKFMIRGNLVRHMKMHDKEKVAKPSVCNLCGKILSNKYSLATHMKTHNRDTTYKCNQCEKAFVTKYTLSDHMRRIHEEFDQTRDKECQHCGRTFFTNSELKYHIKTHTGERPYRCNVCKEAYLSSSTLRYHLQKHSNVMFMCRDCNAKFKNYVGWSAHMKRVHGVSCVKEYTKQHGIAQVVKNDDQSLYLFPEGHSRAVSNGQNFPSGTLVDREGENSATLAVGLQETVENAPGKEVDNIIQIVSYEDLKHPLVHTVDALDVGLRSTRVGDSGITNPNSNLSSGTDLGTATMEPMSEAGYSQASDRAKVMIHEGWDIILPSDGEETQVMNEEWEGARIVVPQSTILQGDAGEILALMQVTSP
ncbi:hypothetical protein Pmani_028643 [Petrolisthes manimaculis]|uniref:C2H2-type domain-containing protein n=1 Tax=Petrolisthes manimaculis TaxID=1843537 RepID=A0AAE1NZP1_9EUCA|nr:hypothetical protein Pmani_028643 [Petrolisthes manimaculis]